MKLISDTAISDDDQLAEIWTYQRGMSLWVHAEGFLHMARVAAEAGLKSGPGIDAVAPAILYAIRHAVELFLKSVICDARGLERIAEPPPSGHWLLRTWRDNAKEVVAWLADEHHEFDCDAWCCEFEEILQELEGIDPDGQTLRYPSSRDGQPNLDGREVVSIGQIQRFIEHVHDHMEKLKHHDL